MLENIEIYRKYSEKRCWPCYIGGMEAVLTSLLSVLIALVLGGFAWLRSDIVRLTGRVERLTERVDDLSNRVAKIEVIADGLASQVAKTEGILESRQ